jgi:uncharacterized protein YutE (UPF0331/DUF86 family)
VSDERLVEPETNRELFDRLARHGWLSDDLATTMGRMAGFPDIVVHGYGGVNLEIAKDIVEHRLGDLVAFVRRPRPPAVSPFAAVRPGEARAAADEHEGGHRH